MNETHGIGPGQMVFQALMRVLMSHLCQQDMLHTNYLEPFKHLINWIWEFLKNNGKQQAFEDA